jgi:hypothetical protein
MKRFIAILCSLLILCSLAGCQKISIDYDGDAVLTCDTKKIGMPGEGIQVTVTLTDLETKTVKSYLASAKHCGASGAGCPFHKDLSIDFGDQVIAIGYDSCGCVWIVGTDDYYELSNEAISYINSLFEKYAGYHPIATSRT